MTDNNDNNATPKSLLELVRLGYKVNPAFLVNTKDKGERSWAKVWYQQSCRPDQSSKEKQALAELAQAMDLDEEQHWGIIHERYNQIHNQFLQTINDYVSQYTQKQRQLKNNQSNNNNALNQPDKDDPIDNLNTQQPEFQDQVSQFISNYFKTTQDHRFSEIQLILRENGIALLVKSLIDELNNYLVKNTNNAHHNRILSSNLDELFERIWQTSLASVYDIALLYNNHCQQRLTTKEPETTTTNTVNKPSTNNKIQSGLISVLSHSELGSYMGQKTTQISSTARQSSISSTTQVLGQVGVGLSAIAIGYETALIYADSKQGKTISHDRIIDNSAKYAEAGTMIGGFFASKLNPVAVALWLSRQTYNDYYEKHVYRPKVDQKVQSLASQVRYQKDLLEQKYQQLQQHLQNDPNHINFNEANQIKQDIHQTRRTYQQTLQNYKDIKHEQNIINQKRQSWMPRRERRHTCYIGALLISNSLLYTPEPVITKALALAVSAVAYSALLLDQDKIYNMAKKACSKVISKLKGNNESNQQPSPNETECVDDLASTRELMEQFHNQPSSQNDEQTLEKHLTIKKQLNQTLKNATWDKDSARIMQFMSNVSATVKAQTESDEHSTNQRTSKLKAFLRQFDYSRSALIQLKNDIKTPKNDSHKQHNCIPQQAIDTIKGDSAMLQAMSQIMGITTATLNSRLDQQSTTPKQPRQIINQSYPKVSYPITGDIAVFSNNKKTQLEEPQQRLEDDSPANNPQ